MGQDKATLLVDGKSLLQYVIDTVSPLVREVVVVTRPGQVLTSVSSPVRGVQDVLPGKGPLAGLYSGLVTVASFPALTVACDMPLLQPSLLRYLLRGAPTYDAVVPTRMGLPEPLCAAYGPACIEAIKQRLDGGELKVTSFLSQVRTWLLPEAEWQINDSEGLSFLNVNTPEDLEEVRRRLARP